MNDRIALNIKKKINKKLFKHIKGNNVFLFMLRLFNYFTHQSLMAIIYYYVILQFFFKFIFYTTF